ncbi:MAG TPA: PAS domain-containing protein [Acidimicrobiia bacterium]|nr:PAS domain-containing protein [Acidimicrobiia bacterium]
MAQQPLQLILMRELADHLATPVFVVNAEGTLEFYNEPAGLLLGLRFEETGPMAADVWASRFTPTDEHGVPITADELPLVRALRGASPGHRRIWIQSLDGARRHLEVTAFPMFGITGELIGATALFWETA